VPYVTARGFPGLFEYRGCVRRVNRYDRRHQSFCKPLYT
jgi:hypothetical protein